MPLKLLWSGVSLKVFGWVQKEYQDVIPGVHLDMILYQRKSTPDIEVFYYMCLRVSDGE